MVQWIRAIPGYGTLQAMGPSRSIARETNELGVIRVTDTLTYPVACVWDASDTGYGHASVFIQKPSGEFADESDRCYASLFPGEDVRTGRPGARKEHLGLGRKLSASFTTFKEDCASESGEPGGFRLPDHMIPLGNLDQPKMQAAWNAIRDKPDAHYRLLRKNCSTVAARVIRAGMGTKQLALTPFLAHKAWWTPYDVLLLAQFLERSDYDRRIGDLVKALKL